VSLPGCAKPNIHPEETPCLTTPTPVLGKLHITIKQKFWI